MISPEEITALQTKIDGLKWALGVEHDRAVAAEDEIKRLRAVLEYIQTNIKNTLR